MSQAMVTPGAFGAPDSNPHPHSHHPDLESGQVTVLAEGHFRFVRTRDGRYFAEVHVMTALGEIRSMIEVTPHAANAIALAQHEHVRRTTHMTGPVAKVQTGGPVSRRTIVGYMRPPGHTSGFVPPGDEMSVGYAWDEMATGLEATGFDFGDIGHFVSDPVGSVAHAIEHVVVPIGKTVAHVAAPVVNAVKSVANKVGHAIDTVAKSAEHGVADAVKTAAKIVAKAHLGDISAAGFIKDVVHAAESGVEGAKNAANALAQGAAFVERHIDIPKIVADAIPIPAIRSAAQSVIGMVDPQAKLADAIDALRTGNVDKLRQMADQEISEMQGVASLVPGIGSGISAAMGAAEALLHGGSPLEIALRAAYGAIPIPPGVREVTDTVLDAVLALLKGGNITDAALAVARDRIPSGIPRDVFDTLVSIIAKHQPITKAAEDLAGHYVATYTQGLTNALTSGLDNLVKPISSAAAAALGRLPDPMKAFASFAPHLKEINVATTAAKLLPPGVALPPGILPGAPLFGPAPSAPTAYLPGPVSRPTFVRRPAPPPPPVRRLGLQLQAPPSQAPPSTGRHGGGGHPHGRGRGGHPSHAHRAPPPALAMPTETVVYEEPSYVVEPDVYVVEPPPMPDENLEFEPDESTTTGQRWPYPGQVVVQPSRAIGQPLNRALTSAWGGPYGRGAEWLAQERARMNRVQSWAELEPESRYTPWSSHRRTA
jgi:hypothetical protein